MSQNSTTPAEAGAAHDHDDAAIVALLTSYARPCALCTAAERRAYGNHCGHSGRRWKERLALAQQVLPQRRERGAA